MKDSKYIQVIETNREKNMAYVWMYYGPECVKGTNTVLPLDKVEELFRCKFDDGVHGWTSTVLDESTRELWKGHPRDIDLSAIKEFCIRKM